MSGEQPVGNPPILATSEIANRLYEVQLEIEEASSYLTFPDCDCDRDELINSLDRGARTLRDVRDRLDKIATLLGIRAEETEESV